MADVFLSYARHDEEKARRIADLLVAEGYDVWWDADMPPHRAYSDVIQEEVDRAKAVLVIWSKDAIASEWVRAEADMARNAHKLVQLSVDETSPPLPFNQIHVVSLADWRGGRDDVEWQRIVRSIAEILGRPTAPPSPARRAKSILARLQGLARNRRRLAWIAAGVAAPLLLGAGGLAGWSYARSQSVIGGKLPGGITGSPTPAAEILPLDPNSKVGFIFPDSDRRLLSPDELGALSIEHLNVARNEIFARHGWVFKRTDLREHFCQMDWYLPRTFEVTLTNIEDRNVDLLKRLQVALEQRGEKIDPEKIRAMKARPGGAQPNGAP
jgi:hypothetical protein